MAMTLRILLYAYYEALHERLLARRGAILKGAPEFVQAEMDKHFVPYRADHLTACVEAVAVFLDERIEMYNPIGAQYTLGGAAETEDAFELQLELEWYDARDEYAELIKTARSSITPDLTDAKLPQVADWLIDCHGAWPDKSIIAAYEADPQRNHLPDYVLACLLEMELAP